MFFYIEFLSLVAVFSMLAISAKTAQIDPKLRSRTIRTIRNMRTYFSEALSFIINDLKNKDPHLTDFLRTHFQTPSKSP